LTKDYSKFKDQTAVSQITTSKPSILNSFRRMNSNKPYEKQIKPFNFMLIGQEKYGVIPCLPYDKDITGIRYRPFIDYKLDTTSDKLPAPTYEYWYTLEEILNKYIEHNDRKFDYDNEGIAHRKHIVIDNIRYIGKESNNLDDNHTGIEDPDYLEYTKDHEIVNSKEFLDWTSGLKPKDVKNKGISQQALYYQKSSIKNGKNLNIKQKVVRKLLDLYKQTMFNNKD